MKEFERVRRDSAGTGSTGRPYPEDFSLDEAAFASELRELFPLEEEVLPPQFIQTVMEDEWRSPTSPGFEQKLTYNVFSRLSLPRGPLFPRQRRAPLASLASLRRAFTGSVRPLSASFVAVVMLMIFSVVVASPSFAAGVQLLLAHTGVRQVNHYPANVRPPTPAQRDAATALTPTFDISWLGATADKYVFTAAQALPAQDWSDGPIVEMQYTLPHDTPGSGILDIREFKVSPKLQGVLQEVQEGSATPLSVGGIPAVYVDGIWVDPLVRRQPMMDTPIWQFGIRSELMIELNGVVFWIVGDQRDGANQAELVKFAQMLTVTNGHVLHPYAITLHGLGESVMQVFQQPHGHEVLYYAPKGAALTSGTGITIQSNNISY
jgi:hypothetical protein